MRCIILEKLTCVFFNYTHTYCISLTLNIIFCIGLTNIKYHSLAVKKYKQPVKNSRSRMRLDFL